MPIEIKPLPPRDQLGEFGKLLEQWYIWKLENEIQSVHHHNMGDWYGRERWKFVAYTYENCIENLERTLRVFLATGGDLINKGDWVSWNDWEI